MLYRFFSTNEFIKSSQQSKSYRQMVKMPIRTTVDSKETCGGRLVDGPL